MSNKTDSKISMAKKENMNQNFINYNQFIEEHRVAKGTKDITHTAYGEPWGSFIINDDDYQEFINHYSKVVGRMELHMIERPKEVGPLLIDIDWRFDNKYHNRQYNEDDIKFTVQRINKVLKKYYRVTKKTLKAFAFEKEKPSYDKKNKQYKDGFHIVYPFMGLSTKMRYLIINKTKNLIKEEDPFTHLDYINDYNTDVFDTSIIESNGWTMFGSRKHDGQMYHLTKIYKYDMEEEDIKKYKINQLVSILSNRKFDDDEEFEFNSKLDKDILEKELLSIKTKKQKKNKNEINFDDDNEGLVDIDTEEYEERRNKKKNRKDRQLNDIEMAEELVELLSNKRAENYHDWIHIGWALHNVSESLLDVWKDFSKRCPSKYDEETCNKIWFSASDEGFTIASLHLWAQMDNPTGYYDLLKSCIKKLYEEAENGTEYDISRVIYELYKHKFKCTSLKNNTWYEFQSHRWIEIEQGYTLNMKISEELTTEFAKLNATYFASAATKVGLERDTDIKKADNITKIILKFKKPAFKDSIMRECQKLFFDPKFEERLDSNKDLIGFDNGVYDLKNMCFRNGTPDDCVTFSVGYDWREYHMDHKYIKGIENFFEKTMKEKDMREYIKTLLASYLDGHTKDEKFILWTGSGCHAIDTDIMMYDGSIKKVEKIKVNELLMGDDGTPRRVRLLHQGHDTMFRIIPNGSNISSKPYVVTQTHRLSLKFTGYDKLEQIGNEYNVKWCEFDENKIIIHKNKTFDDLMSAREFRRLNKRMNSNYIKKDHVMVMRVKDFKRYYETLGNLFYGYNNYIQTDDNGKNIIKNTEIYKLSVEYAGKDYYYGFELDGNKKYLMGDGTVTNNSNGKSKTVEFFQLAFGDYCGFLPITVLTRKRNGPSNATPEMAMMRGKRFVVFQEPEDDDKIHVGYMKELTGGDWITARPLFKDPIKFKPQFKLLLTCNKLPSIPSTDGGTWRRLRVSPWESEFVPVDKNGLYDGKKLKNYQFPRDDDLLENLEKWKKALMWYLITQYYPKSRNGKIREPPKVLSFTKKYKKDSDIYFEFLDENLIITGNKNDYEDIALIYGMFKPWYKEFNGSATCPSRKQLLEYMINHDYNYKKGQMIGVKFRHQDAENNDLDV